MLDMTGIMDELLSLWGGHRVEITLGTLGAVVLLLVVTILWAAVRGRIDTWIICVTWIAGFAFSADSMWIVTTQQANVTPIVAVGVFFVGEAMQVTSMRKATRHYRRTAEHDATGKLVRPGDPGKHGRAVWTIAVVMGVIVALAAHNRVEAVLRPAIPLGIAMLWWTDLTAEGTTRQRGRWRWTPTRLLEWLRAIEPDTDRDLTLVERERQIVAMTRTRWRLRTGAWPRRFHEARLRRLAFKADEAIAAEVDLRELRLARMLAPLTGVGGAASQPAIGDATVATSVALATATRQPAIGDATPPATVATRQLATGGATEVANEAASSPATPPATSDAAMAGDGSPLVPLESLPESAQKIAKLRTRNPRLTQREVMTRTGLGERTVSRYWGPTTPAVPAATVAAETAAEPLPMNGNATSHLVSNGGAK